MKKKSIGQMIASLRKEKGLTQLGLAEKMGVTDKAVSKWERDLSCPDVNTIPKLAEALGTNVEELMQSKEQKREPVVFLKLNVWEQIALKAVAVGMGIAVAVLAGMNQLDMNSGLGMLGIGLACLGISQFTKDNLS